jgi:hypothetical protein
MVLRHLLCKEMQFLRGATGNSLLQPMSVNHFSPRNKRCTEDDGEPVFRVLDISQIHVINSGHPIIEGTRVFVDRIIGHLENGMSIGEICHEYLLEGVGNFL